MKVNKVKKDGTPSRMGEGGGNHAGTQGRKANIEKLIESRVEDLRDITRVEFWARMAKDKAVVRLEGILDSTEAKDETVLAAVKEVLNRALGKSKEFVDLTSMGQQMYQPLTPEQLALLKAKNDKQ